jgi:hypothetical protein
MLHLRFCRRSSGLWRRVVWTKPNISEEHGSKETNFAHFAACTYWFTNSLIYILNMDTIYSFETSIFPWTTWYDNPEERTVLNWFILKKVNQLRPVWLIKCFFLSILFNLSSLACFGLRDHVQKDISARAETTTTMCFLNINS